MRSIKLTILTTFKSADRRRRCVPSRPHAATPLSPRTPSPSQAGPLPPLGANSLPLPGPAPPRSVSVDSGTPGTSHRVLAWRAAFCDGLVALCAMSPGPPGCSLCHGPLPLKKYCRSMGHVSLAFPSILDTWVLSAFRIFRGTLHGQRWAHAPSGPRSVLLEKRPQVGSPGRVVAQRLTL